MTDLSQTLKEQFAFLQPRPSRDCPAFDCPTEKVLDVLAALKAQHGFDLLCDVTAIDLFDAVPRFLVVYHLYATQGHRYLRVVTPCRGDSESPTCPSVTALWAGADWHEREAYDMFGIVFEGHGDLRRILMWDGYPYHPLRKEFPLAGIEVPLPAADIAERTGVTVAPAPMMGGPFHAPQHGTMARREPRADDESWNEHRPKDARQAGSETPRDLRKA